MFLTLTITGLALAEQHSIAVDYPKSGVPPALHPSLRPQQYPHFMPSKFRAKDQIYKSTSVLGALYDRVPDYDFNPDYNLPFDRRILDAFEHDQERLVYVSEIKHEYDNAVRRVMAQHAIATEFEIWSSFVMNHAKVVNDYKIAEEVGHLSSAIKEQFADIMKERAGGSDFDSIAPWVAAMYTVTAQQTAEKIETLKEKSPENDDQRKQTLESAEMPLITFPWIFHRELGKIAQGSNASAFTNITAVHTAPKSKKNQALLIDFDDPNDMLETSAGKIHGGQELTLTFGTGSTNNENATEGGAVASPIPPMDEATMTKSPLTTSNDPWALPSDTAALRHQRHKDIDENIVARSGSRTSLAQSSPAKNTGAGAYHLGAWSQEEDIPTESSSSSVATETSTPSSVTGDSCEHHDLAEAMNLDALSSKPHDNDMSMPLSPATVRDDLTEIFGTASVSSPTEIVGAMAQEADHEHEVEHILMGSEEEDEGHDWLLEEEGGGVQEIKIVKNNTPTALDRLNQVLAKGS